MKALEINRVIAEFLGWTYIVSGKEGRLFGFTPNGTHAYVPSYRDSPIDLEPVIAKVFDLDHGDLYLCYLRGILALSNPARTVDEAVNCERARAVAYLAQELEREKLERLKTAATLQSRIVSRVAKHS